MNINTENAKEETIVSGPPSPVRPTSSGDFPARSRPSSARVSAAPKGGAAAEATEINQREWQAAAAAAAAIRGDPSASAGLMRQPGFRLLRRLFPVNR